ncbi:MAG TPA: HAMP domain-containing sensor histidine kinase [Acidobacteriaceae bacterium]|nr:HAMP domain-containing sensor histidine kinase [Acidobacteriaceae bacterium]
MKPYSLTHRLIATVLLIELVSALSVTAVALLYERHAHFRAFDVLLRGRADSMLGAVQDAEDKDDNVMLDGTETAVPKDDVYEVTDAGGRVLGRSANWPVGQISDSSEHVRPRSHDPGDASYFETSIQGRAYRMIRLHGLRIVDPGDKGGGVRRYVVIYYGSSVRRVWQAVLRAVSFYALSSLAVLACTGVLMSWLLNRGLAPLRELAAGAERVSATSWTFVPPPEARMSKELAPLASALETLLHGLEQSFEQQRRFVGDAAHELKTSVAVVKSSLQLLGMKPRTPGEYQAGLERCLADCGRMEAIVAQMLTLAHVEEGQSAGSPACRTDISIALREVAQELEAVAQSREISIEVQDGSAMAASIEPEHFKLLCTNLLMNALQHSLPGSAVTIRVARAGDFAEVEVADHGEGIAPEELPRIFERFFRSDPSRSRKTGGTGLGLAICKAVVDRYGGSIAIHSKLAVGTNVLVRIPISVPASILS